MASPDDSSTPYFNPTAGILAWIWPGLGHIVAGEARRGRRVMFGVLLLVVCGLLVGGLDCVDRDNDHLWFYAQALCGPVAFAADFGNQTLVQSAAADWSKPETQQRYLDGDPEVLEGLSRFGIAHVNEMGTLFVALAGLMNLVVILDAMFTRPAAAEGPTE